MEKFKHTPGPLELGKKINELIDQSASGGGSAKKYATCVVGITTSGHTAEMVDFLCDGTNDQAEIQTALSSLISGGKVLLLEGTYNLADGITLTQEATVLEGMGNSTYLKFAATGYDNVAVKLGNANCTVQNFLLAYEASGHTPTGIQAEQSGCSIRRVNITGDFLKHIYITEFGYRAKVEGCNLWGYTDRNRVEILGQNCEICQNSFENVGVYVGDNWCNAARCYIHANEFLDYASLEVLGSDDVRVSENLFSGWGNFSTYTNQKFFMVGGVGALVSQNILVSEEAAAWEIQQDKTVCTGNKITANSLTARLHGEKILISGNHITENSPFSSNVNCEYAYNALFLGNILAGTSFYGADTAEANGSEFVSNKLM